MKYILSPSTFFVSELFNPKLSKDKEDLYYYYLLEKKGISHKKAVDRIFEECCGGRHIKIFFCGIKDRNASTKQWFCTDERIGEAKEDDFEVRFVGCGSERLFVGKHKGNAFRVVVELDGQDEAEALKHFKSKNELICNYFGAQRFGEKSTEFAELIESKDYEGALKSVLTKKSSFDTNRSATIRDFVLANWGNWKKIAEFELVKDTKKAELFSFLALNPNKFREAFALAEPKSTSAMVKASQALRFNSALAKIAFEKKPNNVFGRSGEINGVLGGAPLGASKAFKREIEIEPSEFEKQFRRAPLVRKTFFSAQKFKVKNVSGLKFELSFELGKGEYATIFLKYLDSWISKNKR